VREKRETARERERENPEIECLQYTDLVVRVLMLQPEATGEIAIR